jgi:hypothetical protein
VPIQGSGETRPNTQEDRQSNLAGNSGIGSRVMRTYAGVMCVLAMALGCAAQERALQTKGTAVLLSEVLPGPLAQFVKRSGADRRVDDVLAENLRKIEETEAHVDFVVEVLRPTTVHEASASATLSEELAPKEQATDTKEAQTLLVAGTKVFLSNGEVVQFGAGLFLGDVIEQGLVLNAGDTKIVIAGRRGPIVLAPGEGVLVGCPRQCSTSCNTGSYACCSEVGGCARCACVLNGTVATCDAGGPNANACSVVARSSLSWTRSLEP